jgi:hypothetical protein|eukprot:g5524.t1
MAELTVAAATGEGGLGEGSEAASVLAVPALAPVVEKEESLEDLVSLLFTQLRSTPEEKWVQDASSIDNSVLEAFANAGVGGVGDEKSSEKPAASSAEGERPPNDS